MKTFKLLLLSFMVLSLTSCNKSNSKNHNDDNTTVDSREFYQLKVYTFDSASQMTTTDKYLNEAAAGDYDHLLGVTMKYVDVY